MQGSLDRVIATTNHLSGNELSCRRNLEETRESIRSIGDYEGADDADDSIACMIAAASATLL